MPSTAVAVGILQSKNQTSGGGESVLLQQRSPQQSYSGYWEFPGGKANAGETPAAALVRELREELNIQVCRAHAWLCLPWTYKTATVQLHFFRVVQWDGTPRGHEGQKVQWHHIDDAPPSPLLPASYPIWKGLQLPPLHAVTAAEIIGVDACIARLPNLLTQNAKIMIQLRDKNLSTDERRRLGEAIIASEAIIKNKTAAASLVVNDDAELAAELGGGLHLSSKKLMQTQTRPPFTIVGASCHTADEVAHAAALGCDYGVLSPVQKTLTHVRAAPLGWTGFARIATAAPLPLYALGGLTHRDLPTATAHGACGIALMRQAWH